jgi:GTP-binding protein
MFVDEVQISVKAGRGGDGRVSFRREKYVPRGGPNGGDGGKGGDVVLVATRNSHTLAEYRHKHHVKAKNGEHGGTNNRTGADGEDAVMRVPVGTLVWDEETGELLADLTDDGDTFVVATGGDGGRGNAQFKSSTRRAPKKATPGREGEERNLKLELKLIADVALVGYPSVGKSTIIAALSNAQPKIADYPFTTLTPNLGVVKFGSYGEYVIADVPGLIEGAHEGHGLGIQFLKHIERTNLIAHVLEVTPQLEGHETERDPIADFERLQGELAEYNPELVERPTIVVLNKIDLPFVQEREEELREHFESRGYDFIAVSAATGQNLDELRNRLGEAVTKGKFDTREAWER